jgi:peptidoglycan/LPS O-acetylase OafA/YrhL
MSPYGRIIEFSMGIIAGLFLKNGSKFFKYQFHGLIASSIIILLVSYLSLNKDISSPTMALLRMSPLLSLPLFYLMLSLVSGNDITEKFYSNRILTSIGKWSYSIYLLAGFSIPVCGGQWVATEAGIFVKSCTQLFVIIVLSFGSYELIEMPARKYLLKMSPVNLFSK